METTLVIITLVALALASTMSIVTLRMVALDRRRETARVAALVDLAREEDDFSISPGRSDRLRQGYGGPPQLHAEAEDRPLQAPVVQKEPFLRPALTEPVQTEIFTQAERESPAGRRFVAVVTVAALMAAAVGALMFARSEPATGTESPAATSVALPADPAVVGTAGVPLELMSLRHERDGEKLTVTGLVLNPRQGARVDQLSVVVYVYDPAGTFLASGRALVDYTKLDPGAESPFVVTVIAPGKIGRYRVGFRGQDGAVVGHVDRRSGA
ncbi:MAG TPA: hypothetical protein VHI98_11055 [Vicinamibacterales bacterium]|jgi:hypothetical protein|nr:hypothetical protein [Vicinamibacterales bacterium]